VKLVLLICLALGPSASPPACAGRLSARQLPLVMFPALFAPRCTRIVGQLFGCDNGRAYAFQGRWMNAGPLRHLAVRVPALVER